MNVIARSPHALAVVAMASALFAACGGRNVLLLVSAMSTISPRKSARPLACSTAHGEHGLD
jgi:hypothetical protein